MRWIDAPGSKVDPVGACSRFALDLIGIRFAAMTGKYKRSSDRAMDRGLRVAVVTAMPPSTASLNEYGLHLVEHLRALTDVEEVIVFAEDSSGLPASCPGMKVQAGWRFDSPLSISRLILAARRHKPDAALFNIHFASLAVTRSLLRSVCSHP